MLEGRERRAQDIHTCTEDMEGFDMCVEGKGERGPLEETIERNQTKPLGVPPLPFPLVK